MAKRDIVVVGASAGGREALTELCRGLPEDFPAALFIVWHMPSSGVGTLARILNRVCVLPAQNALDGQPIERGHIYVAPIDHHLLVERERMRVTKGPKENRFRPAIDPLFRSAAYAYGPRVIGVVLSGALNDGTSGLWTIKDLGGIAIVQDPEDALVSGMPSSALENVDVDYRLPVAEIPALLLRLTREEIRLGQRAPVSKRLEAEVKIAQSQLLDEAQLNALGQVTEYTCPECHGTLWQLYEGKNVRFRCRTGHAYTADALLEDMAESIEAMEWAAVRGIQESVVLMEHMANHLLQSGDAATSQRFLEAAVVARERSELIQEAISRDITPQGGNGAGSAPV